MKKKIIALIIIMLSAILVVLCADLFIRCKTLKLAIDKINNDEYIFTIPLGHDEYIEYDEEYAINETILIYKKLYGIEYSPEDFIVEEYNSDCWNVYLKESVEWVKKVPGLLFDGKYGLIINKDCGAIIYNFGEEKTTYGGVHENKY